MKYYLHPGQTQRDSLRGKFSPVQSGVPSEALGRLPRFVRELLDSCPIAGKGVHMWIFRVARHLLAHFDQQATFEVIKAKAAGCGRPLEKLEREIASQIQNAFPHRWQPKYPHAFARYRAMIVRRAQKAVR
jgi:hypothetical protein